MSKKTEPVREGFTRVILVRHGETVCNIEGKYQGRIDSPLTPKGERQALCAAESLKDHDIARIYSSPLKRAVRTAEIVRGGRDIQITMDQRLLEIDCGLWEGVTFKDVRERYPRDLEIWEQEPHRHVMPGGESLMHVHDRVREAFIDIVAQNSGKTVLIVSHLVLIMLFMAHCAGENVADLWRTQNQGNAAISIVDVDTDKNIHIVTRGDCSHLGQEDFSFENWQSWTWDESKAQ